VEESSQPPDAGAASVLVVGLRAGVTLGRLHAAVCVLAPAIIAVIAPGDRILRPLLVDQDEIDHDACVVRPREARRHAPIPDEVAGSHRFGDHATGSIAENAGRAVTVSRSKETLGHSSNESGSLYQR